MDVKTEAMNGVSPLPQRNKGGNVNNQQKPPQHQQQEANAEQMDTGPPSDKKQRLDNTGGGGQNYDGKYNQGGMGGGRGGNNGGMQRSRDRRRTAFRNEPNDQNNMGGGGSGGGSGGGGGGGGGGFGSGGGGGFGGGGAGGGGPDRRNRGPGMGGSGGGGGGGFGGGGPDRRSRGPGMGGSGGGGRSEDFFISQRLRSISGPTHELPAVEVEESKFSGRNRLYIGNLTSDVTEGELREIFKPYGEIGEVFSNPEKNFAFLKLDFHANAEKAKRELDGTMRKGRALRVRFAPNSTILRVKNLAPLVSNELLYKSFEIFGPVEKAVITVDDRGKHTGEGTVEFAKKSSANAALRLCNDRCFFLTASLRPCVVEPFEIIDDADGLPDKALNKKTQEYNHERSVGPRFAELDSFEHEYGTRWKQLYEMFKTKQDALKRELRMEEDKLEAQMEYARYEHETEMLRQELRKREQGNDRKKMEWEMREKQAEELKIREEENLRRQQSEMQNRMLRQEEEMRRRQQENTLFMQAQQLNSLLDQQEEKQGGGPPDGGNGPNFDNGNNPSDGQIDFRDVLNAFANNNPGNMGGPPGGPNNPQDQFNPFEFGNNQQNQNKGGPGNQRGGGGNNKPWERRRRF